MNNIKYFLLLFLIVLPDLIFTQVNPSGALSPSTSGRLIFSEQAREFFTEELTLPGKAEISGELITTPTSKVKISATSPEDGIWRLTFDFPIPVTFKQQIDGDNLSLEFNQGIDSTDLINVQEQLGYLLKRFSNGFYTLYLEGKRAVYYIAEAQDKTFILYIIPDYNAPLEETRAVKIASARLLVEERRYFDAFDAIEELEEEYPENKDIPVLEASLEGLLPRWQRQLRILQDVHAEHPEDDDITKLMWDAWTPHCPYIRGERQIQRTLGLAVVQYYRLEGETILSASPCSVLYGGTRYQLARGHVEGLVDNEGNIIGFLGTRNQGEVYARQEWESGTYLKGSFYAQDEGVGVGAEAGMLVPNLQGQTNIVIDWHHPYWAVFETLDFHGREDRLKIQVSSVVNRYFNWELEGGPHRVGIIGTPTGFVAMQAASEIFINVINPNPIIAFNYGIDADYILSHKVKQGVDGQPYFPVPYTSFENHSLRIYCYYTWRERWNFMMFAGETFNRIGLNAATCGFSVKYVKPCPCGWEFELSAYRFPSTTVQGASSEYYTANFAMRF